MSKFGWFLVALGLVSISASFPAAAQRWNVCTGEFEGNCPSNPYHDAWIGCNNPHNWARAACYPRPWGEALLYRSGGNQCGYDVIEITCH
jgi:hypothetical protein